MIAAISVLVLVAFCVVMIFGDWSVISSQRVQIEALWKLINDLEADKRALTESLTRSQGNVYIPARRDFKESAGWYDGADYVKGKEGENGKG